MTYQQAAEFITAKFIYENVTQEEIDAVKTSKYVTQVDGVKLLGVEVEIEALADKLLMPSPDVEGEVIDVEVLE